MHWPGQSREKAIRPGPIALVTKKSSPAILRLTPPGSLRSSIFTPVSFHSSVWCSNITGSLDSSIWSSGTSTPRMW
jgi:hypothetical protein